MTEFERRISRITYENPIAYGSLLLMQKGATKEEYKEAFMLMVEQMISTLELIDDAPLCARLWFDANKSAKDVVLYWKANTSNDIERDAIRDNESELSGLAYEVSAAESKVKEAQAEYEKAKQKYRDYKELREGCPNEKQ